MQEHAEKKKVGRHDHATALPTTALYKKPSLRHRQEVVIVTDLNATIRSLSLSGTEESSISDHVQIERGKLTLKDRDRDSGFQRFAKSLAKAEFSQSSLYHCSGNGFTFTAHPMRTPLSAPKPSEASSSQSDEIRLVIVLSIINPAQECHERLRNSYQFTAAETTIALLLSEGMTLAEIAERRRVTMNTLRYQVKTILAKVSCKTQHQLVSKILRTEPTYF